MILTIVLGNGSRNKLAIDNPRMSDGQEEAGGQFSQTELLCLELYDGCKGEKFPLELYVLKMLVKSIDASYEPETLKAQAVILRSRFCAKGEDGQAFREAVAGVGALPRGEMAEEENGTALYNMLQAVLDTKGIVMEKDGKIVSMSYHSMSSGATRGNDETGSRSALCSSNLSAKKYISKIEVSQDRTGVLGEVRRDEQGYVQWIRQNGEWVSGEKFRTEIGLASANFSWEKKKGTYYFTVKGIGHGYGFDQYYANELAKKGDDFQEILHYFDDEISFERIE